MDRAEIHIVSNGYEETLGIGRRLAGLLTGGDVVALYGELGSGKTVLAKGICVGLGISDDVTSPTFTLIQEYTGPLRVFHFDFYRIKSPGEVEDLDIDGYIMAGGVCIVEWAEKGDALLPEGHVSVTLDRIEENGSYSVNKRSIRLAGPQGRGLSDLKL